MQWSLIVCFLGLLSSVHVQCKHFTPHRDTSLEEPIVGCVSSCYGVRNGYYHSCKGCHVYVTCSNGIIYDARPCPARLKWDDVMKRCTWSSSTCRKEVVVKEKLCVDDCTGRRNGDYQSCSGCDVYVTCSNRRIYDNRPCPWILVWDDNLKTCNWDSNTCEDDSYDD